jgi:uncharacterized protein (DUF885 family)
MIRRISALVVILAVPACAGPEPAGTGPAEEARSIATEFADGYYHQFPEEAYEIGYPDTPMDRLGDRSLAAMDAWRAREDAWVGRLQELDTTALKGTNGWVPWAFTLDRLEASRGRRACHMELWNVSPT